MTNKQKIEDIFSSHIIHIIIITFEHSIETLKEQKNILILKMNESSGDSEFKQLIKQTIGMSDYLIQERQNILDLIKEYYKQIEQN